MFDSCCLKRIKQLGYFGGISSRVRDWWRHCDGVEKKVHQSFWNNSLTPTVISEELVRGKQSSLSANSHFS